MKTKFTLFFVFFCVSLVLAGCQGSEQKASKKPQEKAKASHPAQKPGYIYGKVKETMNGGGYTYILLDFEGKSTWVAVPPMDVKVGDEVMLYPGQVMKNFHSKSLNKTFETIVFSQGPVSPPSSKGKASNPSQMALKAHSSTPRMAKKAVKVEPATGPGAITVAMAYKKAKELNGKKVVLKAVVVKVSKNILGKNWIHCQDGTGSESGKDFDITVTTKASPAVGDTVLVKGTLSKDKDIGAGYFYPVIIEDAEVEILKK